jgi:hypothetical protein
MNIIILCATNRLTTRYIDKRILDSKEEEE